MSDTRDKPCMSHYPEIDHYCVFKKQGCEYHKEYNNIAVWDLTFYWVDDDGNELKDDNGKVITYRTETDCTYLADGLDIDDLEVITDER